MRVYFAENRKFERTLAMFAAILDAYPFQALHLPSVQQFDHTVR